MNNSNNQIPGKIEYFKQNAKLLTNLMGIQIFLLSKVEQQVSWCLLATTESVSALVYRLTQVHARMLGELKPQRDLLYEME